MYFDNVRNSNVTTCECVWIVWENWIYQNQCWVLIHKHPCLL